MNLWIKHPRTGQEDTMLTIAVSSTAVVLGKVLLNGVSVASVNFGTIDASLATGVLAATLGAYWARKHTDKVVESK